jgi:hypothetical protein
MWISTQEINSRENHAGRADTALSATIIDERLLNRVKLIVVRDAFDGSDFGFTYLDNWNQATIHNSTVDDYCASATFTFPASFLCSSEF